MADTAVADPIAPVAEADTGLPADPPIPPKPDDPPPKPAAVTIAPESLTLPENTTIDPAVRERIAAIASARGLSAEHAQAMLDSTVSEIALSNEAAIKAYQPGGAEWTKQSEAWKAETLADPTLGKTEAERTAAVNKGFAVVQAYTTQHPTDGAAFKSFLEDSGLGQHPVASRFFAWLGKAAGEQPYINASAPSNTVVPLIPGGHASKETWFPNTPSIAKPEG